MRWRHFVIFILGGFFLAACSRSDHSSSGSSSSSSSSSSQEMGPTITNPGLFSYQAPKGWMSQVATNGYPQSALPRTSPDQFTPDITFLTEGYQSIPDFVKSYQPALQDVDTSFPLKLVDQKPFTTAAGVEGVRLHSIDPSNPPTAEQFSYIFPGQSGMLMEFACACAPADAAHYTPIFDVSMKTVVILNPGD